MVKKIFTSFSYGLVGIILATAGIWMLSGKKSTTTNKVTAADTPYEAHWSASKVLVARSIIGQRDPIKTQIGPWEWTVDGQIGETKWHEVWNAPSIEGVGFHIVPGGGCNVVGVADIKRLLAGCMGAERGISDDNSNLLFEVGRPDDPALVGSQYKFNAGTGAQAATSCRKSVLSNDTDCLLTTGAYGFSYFYQPGGTVAGESSLLQTGFLMPLHWDVVGTLTE